MSGLTFEWDERKRLMTIEKHGIDFVDAVKIFDFNPLVLRSQHEEEERFIAIGPLFGAMVAVVFTPRETAIRVVTARKARQNERRAYHASDTR